MRDINLLLICLKFLTLFEQLYWTNHCLRHFLRSLSMINTRRRLLYLLIGKLFPLPWDGFIRFMVVHVLFGTVIRRNKTETVGRVG
ncbi:p10 [Hibiscus yellow blotch virus]|uniref:p10 n=1 Tax=Hibiscus yellow blotch virus TaxID=2809748 RepID=A0A890CSE5_9VIRU|nr:p10 [Hibiscus yellow blotch virus]QRG34867.1 p10 [Hibiscus yellow blotch virus]